MTSSIWMWNSNDLHGTKNTKLLLVVCVCICCAILVEVVQCANCSSFRTFSFIIADLSFVVIKVETPIHDNDLILTPIIAPQSG
jgi:hypothetical protein